MAIYELELMKMAQDSWARKGEAVLGWGHKRHPIIGQAWEIDSSLMLSPPVRRGILLNTPSTFSS